MKWKTSANCCQINFKFKTFVTQFFQALIMVNLWSIPIKYSHSALCVNEIILTNFNSLFNQIYFRNIPLKYLTFGKVSCATGRDVSLSN